MSIGRFFSFLFAKKMSSLEFLKKKISIAIMSCPIIELWGKRGFCEIHQKNVHNFASHWVRYHQNHCYDCCRDIIPKNWFRHCSSLVHQKNEKGSYKTSKEMTRNNIPQSKGKSLFYPFKSTNISFIKCYMVIY